MADLVLMCPLVAVAALVVLYRLGRPSAEGTEPVPIGEEIREMVRRPANHVDKERRHG